MLLFNTFAAKQEVMTTEEYFYLDHYLEHYAIIFGNNDMKSLFNEVDEYQYFLFKNTEQISFEEGKSKVEYFYNKAQPFEYWPKPTFRINEPKPFA